MNTLLGLFLLISATLIGQADYKNGYFVYNNGQRVACQIKDSDWAGSPRSIRYRLSESSNSSSVSLSQLSVFEIYDRIKYVKRSLPDSNKNDGSLTVLKVLVAGEHSLLQLVQQGISTFYVEGSYGIVQLTFEETIDMDNRVRSNKGFRKQLSDILVCNDINRQRLKKTEYRRDDLVELFRDYHNCANLPFEHYTKNLTTSLFEVHGILGVNFSDVVTSNVITNRLTENFEAKRSLTFGASFQYYFPIKNNKWSVIFEPAYQMFRGTKDIELFEDDIIIDYSSISTPIGLQYAVFHKDKFSLAITAFYAIDLFIIDNIVDFPLRGPEIIKNTSAAALGITARTDKLSLEFRYYSERRLLGFQIIRAQYSNFGLIAKYLLLSK